MKKIKKERKPRAPKTPKPEKIKFRKNDKVKLIEGWGNHWFDKSIIVSKNQENKKNYNIISEDGFCEMENVPPEFLKEK